MDFFSQLSLICNLHINSILNVNVPPTYLLHSMQIYLDLFFLHILIFQCFRNFGFHTSDNELKL